jgi:hypothetical protein
MMTKHYLIKHNFAPTISQKGRLVFVVESTEPGIGVEVVSLTEKRYIVGPRGNLIRTK